jgi:hypothetical protein
VFAQEFVEDLQAIIPMLKYKHILIKTTIDFIQRLFINKNKNLYL